jgi:5-methylcytosine-specific restriction enzyme A
MPSKPLKPCKSIGCPELVTSGYCDNHKKSKYDYDKRRGTANERGYTYRWQKYRESFLKRNPVCVICELEGIIEPATVVDHIIPHRGDHKLFWDAVNHQSLCKECHDRKTVENDGGLGRSAVKMGRGE